MKITYSFLFTLLCLNFFSCSKCKEDTEIIPQEPVLEKPAINGTYSGVFSTYIVWGNFNPDTPPSDGQIICTENAAGNLILQAGPNLSDSTLQLVPAKSKENYKYYYSEKKTSAEFIEVHFYKYSGMDRIKVYRHYRPQYSHSENYWFQGRKMH